jgi:hypothetical protein
MSGNKGLYSKVNDKGNKVQQDQAGYIQKRQEEGITLGERLGSNAPVPVKWLVLEATWHKHLGARYSAGCFHYSAMYSLIRSSEPTFTHTYLLLLLLYIFFLSKTLPRGLRRPCGSTYIFHVEPFGTEVLSFLDRSVLNSSIPTSEIHGRIMKTPGRISRANI